MPPLPSLPPTSAAMLMNEALFLSRAEPGASERALPHSAVKRHPFGASAGSGCGGM